MTEIRFGGRCEKHLCPKPCEKCAGSSDSSAITVPRETWDALREALKEIISAHPATTSLRQAAAVIEAREALTVAASVSHANPETAPPPEGGAITFENDDADMLTIAYMDGFDAGKKSVQPLGWYCVSRDGLATQCADQRDAELTAKSANRDWPNSAPYRAVQLCEFEAHPQATEPAGFKLVPVEPTQEMLDAVVTTLDDYLLGPDAEKQYREDWAAMLAAAPEAKQ